MPSNGPPPKTSARTEWLDHGGTPDTFWDAEWIKENLPPPPPDYSFWFEILMALVFLYLLKQL